jgi:hypothetical protein
MNGRNTLIAPTLHSACALYIYMRKEKEENTAVFYAHHALFPRSITSSLTFQIANKVAIPNGFYVFFSLQTKNLCAKLIKIIGY